MEATRIKHPSWFQHDDADCFASPEQIASAETLLGIIFPETYRYLLQHFQSGYFAFTNFFSVAPESNWYIVRRNRVITLPKNFLAISDDETSGYYGFLIGADFHCSQAIFYADMTLNQGKLSQEYDSILDYLVTIGLKIDETSIL